MFLFYGCQKGVTAGRLLAMFTLGKVWLEVRRRGRVPTVYCLQKGSCNSEQWVPRGRSMDTSTYGQSVLVTANTTCLQHINQCHAIVRYGTGRA